MKKGVGRKSVASDGHTTDAVYSLQAGKTVDISRVAAESTDLLSAFSTASATLWPAAAPPTRPATGRLAADAAHRAAGVDIDVIAGGSAASYVLCVISQGRGYISIGDNKTTAIVGSLLYVGKAYFSSIAIGDIETFDDSRLKAKFSVSGMRRSVQALRCPQSLRAGAFVQCEGNEKAVSGGRYGDNKVAITTLLGYISSSTSAKQPQKSRIKGKKVCETESARAASDSHLFIPQPQGDKRPGTCLRGTVRPVHRALT